MRFEISPERASKIRIWILIPAAGDLIHSTFAVSLIKLLGTLRTHGLWYDLRFMPGDSLVTRARNNLADSFYNASTEDDDYCLWLDCDILFEPEAVLQMLACNLDFVAAPYTRKGIHWDRTVAAAQLGWPNHRVSDVGGTPNVNYLCHPVRLDQPMPVLEAGSGFWLIKRKVFRMMVEELPEIRYRRTSDEKSFYGRDYAHDFFRVGVWPETGEYLSEDWWFCRQWRNLGGTVHCCFWIETHHIGPYSYPMKMSAISDLLAITGGSLYGPTKGDTHVNGIALTPETHQAADLSSASAMGG